MAMRWLGLFLLLFPGAPPGLQAQERESWSPPELAKQAGCLQCHNVEKKVVGPAWADVADRYRDDAKARERLIETVKKGGKGNWTSITRGVPMPAHSPRLTDDEITRLVDWIRSLPSRKQ